MWKAMGILRWFFHQDIDKITSPCVKAPEFHLHLRCLYSHIVHIYVALLAGSCVFIVDMTEERCHGWSFRGCQVVGLPVEKATRMRATTSSCWKYLSPSSRRDRTIHH